MTKLLSRFTHNWVKHCKVVEKFMYTREIRSPEPVAFVQLGCQLADHRGSEASPTDGGD